MENLSDELVRCITLHLDAPDLIALKSVARDRFRTPILEVAWSGLCHRRWPHMSADAAAAGDWEQRYRAINVNENREHIVQLFWRVIDEATPAGLLFDPWIAHRIMSEHYLDVVVKLCDCEDPIVGRVGEALEAMGELEEDGPYDRPDPVLPDTVFAGRAFARATLLDSGLWVEEEGQEEEEEDFEEREDQFEGHCDGTDKSFLFLVEWWTDGNAADLEGFRGRWDLPIPRPPPGSNSKVSKEDILSNLGLRAAS